VRVRVWWRSVSVATTRKTVIALHHKIHNRRKRGLVDLDVPDAGIETQCPLFWKKHVLPASIWRAGRADADRHR